MYENIAYLYLRPDDGWGDMTETVQLTPSNTSFAGLFGSAVDISDDNSTIIVSAPTSNRIYVYEKPENGWESMTETNYLAPNGTGFQRFGNSVSVSYDGSVIAVGDNYNNAGYYNSGAVYMYVRTNSSWSTEPDAWQDGKLTASDMQANTSLGASVQISADGSYVLSGAVGGNSGHGSVYVFEKPDTGWKDTTEVAQVKASDGSSRFGESICISDDVLAVGAPGDSYSVYGAGAAYVFEKPSDGNWTELTQKAKLSASDGSVNSHLGFSIGVTGNTIICGAPDHNSYYGTTYIFNKPATGWATGEEDSKIDALPYLSDYHANEYYGRNVAVYGEYAAIGAPGRSSNEGCVYVVHYSNSTWETVAVLTASDGKSSAYFGRAVDIYDNTVAVGAGYQSDSTVYIFEKPAEGWSDMTETVKMNVIKEDVNELSLKKNTLVVGVSDAVYVFGKEDGDSWSTATQEAKFTGSSSDNGTFGCSVSVNDDEDVIAVGAYGASSYFGSAYLFVKPDNGEWGSAEKIGFAPSDGIAYGYYGIDVKVTSDVLLVGAIGDDDKGAYSGSVYLYEKPEAGWSNSVTEHKLNAADGAAMDYFGRSVDCMDNMIVVGAEGHQKVYVFEKGTNDPWSDVIQSSVLTPSDASTYFGYEVSVTYNGSLNNYSIISGAYGSDIKGSDSGAAYLYFIATQATNVRIAENKELSVYPNPAEDIIMFGDDNVVNEVSIFNVAGEKLLTSSGGDVKMMNISGLKPGVYIIRITSGNKTYTGRLLKK